MSEANQKLPSAVIGTLKGSGFPFQTLITHLVHTSMQWSVHATEYPWRRFDNDQFLDLVATNGKIFLTVECKKTRQETLTFLLPLGRTNTGDVLESRCLVTRLNLQSVTGTLFCETSAISPPSPCSEFCVVSTSKKGGDQRLLERDAGLVIGATNAFAMDIRQHLRLGDRLSEVSLFLPVIVTNAKIFAAVYKPTEISLEKGEFEHAPEIIKDIPWIRFSKAFNVVTGVDLGVRTVFVVNSAAFEEFLKLLELSSNEPDPQRIKVAYLHK